MKRYIKEYAAAIEKEIQRLKKINKSQSAIDRLEEDGERLKNILFYKEKGSITDLEAMKELVKLEII